MTLQVSRHVGLFQSASALLLVRNRARCAPKGAAPRRLPVENKFNYIQINALHVIAYWQLRARDGHQINKCNELI